MVNEQVAQQMEEFKKAYKAEMAQELKKQIDAMKEDKV